MQINEHLECRFKAGESYPKDKVVFYLMTNEILFIQILYPWYLTAPYTDYRARTRSCHIRAVQPAPPTGKGKLPLAVGSHPALGQCYYTQQNNQVVNLVFMGGI